MVGVIGVIPIDTEKFGLPPYVPPKNRTKISCQMCGEKCWVGPAQKTLKTNNPNFPIICALCVKRYDPDFKHEETKFIKLGDDE